MRESRISIIQSENARTRGEFREDLFYRLNVFPVHLPPLRNRREDIPLLTDYFLHRYCSIHGRVIFGISHSAARALLAYPFPGNVRELENMVERAVILAPERGIVESFHLFSGELDAFGESNRIEAPLQDSDSPSQLTKGPDAIDLLLIAFKAGVTLESFQDTLYKRVIAQSNGNVANAAKTMGMTRAQLAYRIQTASKP